MLKVVVYFPGRAKEHAVGMIMMYGMQWQRASRSKKWKIELSKQLQKWGIVSGAAMPMSGKRAKTIPCQVSQFVEYHILRHIRNTQRDS